MNDQASGLRIRAPRQPASRAWRCIAVCSGKGGVGKTMISLGLAYSLVNVQRRVLLVDADLGLANVDLQAGVDPRFTLQDVVFGKCALNEAVIRIKHGPDILAAASGSPEMVELGGARRQMFVEELVRFAAEYDFMIFDVGAGIGHGVTSFLAAAPEVMVVVANEPTSIMDAYALVKTMARQPQPPSIAAIINMVRSREEGLLLGQKINAITRRHLDLDLRVAGVVPYNHVVPDAIRARRSITLFAPKSPPALALAALAADLAAARNLSDSAIRQGNRMLDQLVALSATQGPGEIAK